MKRYVLGFMFDTVGTSVCLLKKTHPEWQKGRWNGVGGKIEDGEVPLEAMKREFREEAGVPDLDWIFFAKLFDKKFEVFMFFTFSPCSPRQTEEEPIEWFSVDKLPRKAIPNIRWIIPMALSFSRGERCHAFGIEEVGFPYKEE